MSEFNKDELKPPTFLNKEYFENIVKSIESDHNLQLTNLAITPGSKAGDHYASIMFKVWIKYKNSQNVEKECFWVLKTIPLDGYKKELLDDLPSFRNEILLYTKVLPRMEQILQKANDNNKIAPGFIYHSTDPLVIILEDISKLGYTVTYQNLNYDNLKLVANKIAKYHALSMIIDDEKSEDLHFETIYKGKAVRDILEKMPNGVKYIAAQMKACPGFEEIGDKLEGAEEKMLDEMFDVFNEKRPFGYSVLNHGDFHIRNLMFQKTGDEYKNVLFLDFQCPFWGSPVIDLYYLIHMIGDDDVFDRKYEMLRFYHTKFCIYLNMFGYKKAAPSLLDLNIEITKYGPLELMIVCNFVPILRVDYSNIDMSELYEMTGDTAQNHTEKLFNKPVLVAKFKKILPIFFNNGYFNW